MRSCQVDSLPSPNRSAKDLSDDANRLRDSRLMALEQSYLIMLTSPHS